MEEIQFIELTKRGSRDKVLVCLPFDHAEARSDEVYPGRSHTHIRTKGGVDLYVAESVGDIRAMLAALAEYAERGRNHQHSVVRRPDGTDGACCQ
jgi:hypothetical protein